jgi:hypothetical protein
MMVSVDIDDENERGRIAECRLNSLILFKDQKPWNMGKAILMRQRSRAKNKIAV